MDEEIEMRNFGTNRISTDFEFGENFEMGNFNLVHEKCIVGKNVKMMSYVELRPNTIIGNNVYIDSGVKSSGNNKIGNNVTLRFDAIIAREVIVEDDCFISPQFMTIFSDHEGKKIGGTIIGKGSFIGTNVTINHGVKICPGCIIGSKSLVTENLTVKGIYIGIPAKLKRRI